MRILHHSIFFLHNKQSYFDKVQESDENKIKVLTQQVEFFLANVSRSNTFLNKMNFSVKFDQCGSPATVFFRKVGTFSVFHLCPQKCRLFRANSLFSE